LSLILSHSAVKLFILCLQTSSSSSRTEVVCYVPILYSTGTHTANNLHSRFAEAISTIRGTEKSLIA
jgi:hypothetical protein